MAKTNKKEESKNFKIKVDVATLRIRNGASTKSDIIGFAVQGDIFDVVGTDETGKWYKLDREYDSWIMSVYTKKIKEEAVDESV